MKKWFGGLKSKKKTGNPSAPFFRLKPEKAIKNPRSFERGMADKHQLFLGVLFTTSWAFLVTIVSIFDDFLHMVYHWKTWVSW